MFDKGTIERLKRPIAAVAIAMAGLLATQAEADPAERVALILAPDGRGDVGWNDLAWLGTEVAKKEGLVEDVDLFTSSPSEILGLLTNLSAGGRYDLIISNSFRYTKSVVEVANQYPDQNFAQMDSRPKFEEGAAGANSVLAAVYDQEQMSALAGALAAFTVADKGGEHVGLVLGSEFAVLHDFEVGYKFGVKWAVEHMMANQADIWSASAFSATPAQERVLWTYTGTFGDPAKGRAAALLQVENGASVVYQVAGATGIGVLTGIGDYHTQNDIPFTEPPYAIGVDSAQEWINPSIIASGMKRQDNAVRDLIGLVADGTFRDTIAQTGGVYSMSLKNKGVQLSDEEIVNDFVTFAMENESLESDKAKTILAQYKELRAALPEWAWPAIAELQAAIESGDIVVPKPSADPQKWDITALREELG